MQPLRPNTSAEDRIVLSGIGVVSPVGCSVWGTALGLRFRKSSWCEHETVLVADDPCGIVLRGATVSRIPENKIPPRTDGAERALALLSPAFSEAVGNLQPAELKRSTVWVDNFIEKKQEAFDSLLRDQFSSVSFKSSQDSEDPVALKRCTFFERIIKAAEEIQAGQVERVIIGCVDSLCATSWLMSVRDDGILKDSFTPEGIIAAEAAGVVVLELESTARQRMAPVYAVLVGWGRGTENSVSVSSPATGRGLTDAFYDACSALKYGVNGIGSVVADMNGERHRALDWAYTEGRIFADSDQERELRLPAFVAGDCGNATGALMLADAVGLFAFHPRYKRHIALTTSDNSGSRRIICLERGDCLEQKQLMSDIRAILAS